MRCLVAVAALVLAACGTTDDEPGPMGAAPDRTATTNTVPVTPPALPAEAPATAAPSPPSPPPSRLPQAHRIHARPSVLAIPYRVEVRSADPAVADFPDVVHTTLADPRGWQRAAFRFEHRPDAPYLLVIAEGPEVDRLCRPYDTYGKYSCQNGPVVAINADRWRQATPQWTGDLATYRQMLVNHEWGHLLGQRHPKPQCPRPGEPAPVMNQQSTELGGCLPNPWPLDWEVELAARHDAKIAPEYGE